MKTVRFAVAFACLVGAGTRPAVAQFENVGSIDFPTSETGQAQQHVLRGVAILHSFGWNQAIERFETSLLRMPGRARSLLGLARTSAAGEPGKASEAYRELTRVWSGRISFDGYREAERYPEAHGGTQRSGA